MNAQKYCHSSDLLLMEILLKSNTRLFLVRPLLTVGAMPPSDRNRTYLLKRLLYWKIKNMSHCIRTLAS